MQPFTSLPRPLVLGAFALSAVLLTACNPKRITVNAPPPQIATVDAASAETPETMLDWSGNYEGTVPCVDCPGIALRVLLRENKTAVVFERRLDGPQVTAPMYIGPFSFSPTQPSMIRLASSPNSAPIYQFFVGENWLEVRNRIDGTPLLPRDAYRLQKTATPQ